MLSDSFLNFLASNSGGSIGVAVSGGSDSMALLRLAAEAGRSSDVAVRAATVDHGLRVGSAEDALFVASACAELDVAHDVLLWTDRREGGNLQNEARQARYKLLADWALERGLIGVLVGHTADDQAETVLMRLARGAGVDGLAGMPPMMRRDGVSFYRSVLGRKRVELREYLSELGQEWVEDPSNEDTRFDRVKARGVLAALTELGVGVDTLTQVADQMREASSALDALTHANILRLVSLENGDVIFDWRDFCGLNVEAARRFVLAVLNGIAPSVYPPRRAEQRNLVKAVRAQQTVTLYGCLWSYKEGIIRVTRELGAVRDVIAATDALWDNRWTFDGPHAAELQLHVLGEEGLQQCPDWRGTGLPRASLLASPAVWRGDELVAAPLAGMGNGWRATLTRSREQFLSSPLSH